MRFIEKARLVGNNILVGVEYSPFQKIIAPKLSFSQSLLGFGYRINALYYIESEMNRFSIRPEIGFGLFGLKRLKLMFGRNIFFKKNENSKVNTWTGASTTVIQFFLNGQKTINCGYKTLFERYIMSYLFLGKSLTCKS
jgi:hypothetical protein